MEKLIMSTRKTSVDKNTVRNSRVTFLHRKYLTHTFFNIINEIMIKLK